MISSLIVTLVSLAHSSYPNGLYQEIVIKFLDYLEKEVSQKSIKLMIVKSLHMQSASSSFLIEISNQNSERTSSDMLKEKTMSSNPLIIPIQSNILTLSIMIQMSFVLFQNIVKMETSVKNSQMKVILKKKKLEKLSKSFLMSQTISSKKTLLLFTMISNLLIFSLLKKEK